MDRENRKWCDLSSHINCHFRLSLFVTPVVIRGPDSKRRSAVGLKAAGYRQEAIGRRLEVAG